MMNPVKLPFYSKLSNILLAIVLTLFLLYLGRAIFIPLVFALFIAVLLYPIVHFLEKIGLSCSIASTLAIILFILCIGTVIFFLSQQVVNFSEDIPKLEAKLMDMLHHFQHWVSRNYHINSNQQADYISQSVNGMLSNIANSIGNTFISFTEIIIWIIFIFIYTFFFLYYRKLFTRFLLALFLPRHRNDVSEVIAETRFVINSYIKGLLIEMLIIAILNGIVLAMLGIHYAIFIAILAAVLNIIPYLGIYTAIILSLFITLTNGTGSQVLETAIVLVSIHIFDANILMPRIVGGRVKMNPFITIVAVIIGNLLWGIPGMFLFIPLTAIFKIISERVEALKPWAILIGEDTRDINDK